MAVTDETIRAAHETELTERDQYPFTKRDDLYWSDAMLYRAEPDHDPNRPVTIMRVTYEDEFGEPDTSGDFTVTDALSPELICEAQSVSLHTDVYGVALYLIEMVNDPGRPVAIFTDGAIFTPGYEQ